MAQTKDTYTTRTKIQPKINPPGRVVRTDPRARERANTYEPTRLSDSTGNIFSPPAAGTPGAQAGWDMGNRPVNRPWVPNPSAGAMAGDKYAYPNFRLPPNSTYAQTPSEPSTFEKIMNAMSGRSKYEGSGNVAGVGSGSGAMYTPVSGGKPQPAPARPPSMGGRVQSTPYGVRPVGQTPWGNTPKVPMTFQQLWDSLIIPPGKLRKPGY